MEYQGGIEKTDEGDSVHCPGLPGCWSRGESEREALAGTAEAIGEHLIAVRTKTKTGTDAGADLRKQETEVRVLQFTLPELVQERSE